MDVPPDRDDRRRATVGVTALGVAASHGARLHRREIGTRQPAIAEAGRPIQGRGRVTTDPDLHGLGGHEADRACATT